MKLESSKSRLNNQKKKQIKGKITKSSMTFNENKPNFINSEIGVSSFQTSKYEILPAWRDEKQTQYKPKTNPFAKRPKMNIRNAKTMNYEKFPRSPRKKTNPIKANFKPNNQSSACAIGIITNHLEGKPKTKQFSKNRIFSDVNLRKNPRFFKIYAFLIKSRPNIVENR